MARTDVRAPLDSVGGARGWTLCLTRAKWMAPVAQRPPLSPRPRAASRSPCVAVWYVRARATPHRGFARRAMCVVTSAPQRCPWRDGKPRRRVFSAFRRRKNVRVERVTLEAQKQHNFEACPSVATEG